jgi:signal transduction histidine kinase
MASEHDAFPKTLSLITHELATPLSVASGYVRMLLREQAGPLNEKQRKMLEEVEHSCSRIGGLLGEVKELRKLLSNEISMAREKFDFATLVEELASGMHESRDRGVTVQVRGQDGPLPVVGDRRQLGEAVKALFRASLRERGEPGVVVAELSRLSGAQPAALLAIGDDPFRQALRTATDGEFDVWRGGLGVVLPIASRVIEVHGGSLWSTPDPKRDRTRAGWSGGSALRIPLKD